MQMHKITVLVICKARGPPGQVCFGSWDAGFVRSQEAGQALCVRSLVSPCPRPRGGWETRPGAGLLVLAPSPSSGCVASVTSPS